MPCGKCGACLKRAISDWTLRLKQEMKVSSAAYFTTLTYETSPTMELHIVIQGLEKQTNTYLAASTVKSSKSASGKAKLKNATAADLGFD